MARNVVNYPKELFTTSWFSDANLKAYYRFNVTALTTDSSAGGHTLTAIGDPASIAGKFGTGVDLDGNDAYSAVDHADFKPTGNFTVGAWVKSSTVGAYQWIFASYSQNTNFAGIEMWISTGNNFAFYTGKNTGTVLHTDYESIVSTNTIMDGSWHFCVVTWDGSYLRLYRDGVQNATPVAWANAPAYAATNYVRVGVANLTGSNTAFLTGQLDDVFLLNGTALTDAQVALLYNGRNPITQARTVLTYPRNPVGGVYIPGAKSIEGATGDIAITTNAVPIENAKYRWWSNQLAAGYSLEFDTAVTRTGTKTLKVSTTDATGKVYAFSMDAGDLAAQKRSEIKIKPSTAYVFKIWCKTNNVANNSAIIYLDQFDAAGALVAEVSTNVLSGTNDWTLLTWSGTTHATAVRLALYLGNEVAGNISDVWYDVNGMTLIETGATTRTPIT